MADLTDKSNTTPVSGLDDAESVGGASCANCAMSRQTAVAAVIAKACQQGHGRA